MILEHDTMAVIAPAALLQVPMMTEEFYLGEDAEGLPLDETLRTSYHSVASYCEANPIRQPRMSNDGSYFSFRLTLDIEDIDTLKAFALENGLTVLGKRADFEQPLTGAEVFVLSLPHWQEFMSVNPAFKASDEVA